MILFKKTNVILFAKMQSKVKGGFVVSVASTSNEIK